jgi:predicted transcriptional regulator
MTITQRGGGKMGTSEMQVRLSDRTRSQLREVARRARRSEEEIAASLIEGALAADDLELAIIRRRLAEAEAGGPFVRHEDVLTWLEALAEGREAPPPEATVKR